MRFPRYLTAAFVAVFAITAAVHAETIKVGAAVSLKEAFTEIGKTYAAETGDTVEFVYCSSGQVAAQIKSGAGLDAFVSAANKQVDDLTKAGLLDAATRRDVAGNTLVLIIPVGVFGPGSFEALKEHGVDKVAIGEPKTVPAGQYAMEVIKTLKLEDALKDKIVYGTNVRQVLAYVEKGEVTAGLVYATDAKASGSKVHVVATADEKTHSPIVYPAAVVAKSEHAAAAKKFLDYLASEKAHGVLKAQGFTLPKSNAESAAQPTTRP